MAGIRKKARTNPSTTFVPPVQQSFAASMDPIHGLESQLWKAANHLRGSMDAAEYKHVVLGLTCFNYISGTFYQHCTSLRDAKSNRSGE